MMFRTLVTINSILAFVSGAACILIPDKLLAQYDVTLSPMGLVIYQFWGAALIGLGLLTWFARSIMETVFQKKIALALFITNGLSVVMAVRGQFAGANTSGWSTVVMFSLLTLGFGAFLLIKTSAKNKPNEHRELKP
ncbi:hypothetical protein ACFL0H_09280 [Thermodesulfobacteriota bacterium]